MEYYGLLWHFRCQTCGVERVVERPPRVQRGWFGRVSVWAPWPADGWQAPAYGHVWHTCADGMLGKQDCVRMSRGKRYELCGVELKEVG